MLNVELLGEYKDIGRNPLLFNKARNIILKDNPLWYILPETAKDTKELAKYYEDYRTIIAIVSHKRYLKHKVYNENNHNTNLLILSDTDPASIATTLQAFQHPSTAFIIEHTNQTEQLLEPLSYYLSSRSIDPMQFITHCYTYKSKKPKPKQQFIDASNDYFPLLYDSLDELLLILNNVDVDLITNTVYDYIEDTMIKGTNQVITRSFDSISEKNGYNFELSSFFSNKYITEYISSYFNSPSANGTKFFINNNAVIKQYNDERLDFFIESVTKSYKKIEYKDVINISYNSNNIHDKVSFCLYIELLYLTQTRMQ
jgi:hypothetical protein